MKWFLIIIFVCFVLYIYTGLKQADKQGDWRRDVYNKNNINFDDIKIRITDFNFGSEFIYLNDKRLFFVNAGVRLIKEIKKEDILQIDIEETYEHKGKQKVVSLTPQMNINSKLTMVSLKIITENGTYNVSPSTDLYKNRERTIRLKAILEKRTKEVN